MRPETFARRMRALVAGKWRIVDLGTAVTELKSGRIPPYTVVVTIDDGWRSTYALAGPVLADLSIPATLYVTTYYTDRPADVFNVVVHYLIWKTARRHVRLETGHACLDGEYDLSAKPHAVAIRWIASANQQLTWAERQKALESIATSLGFDPADVLRDERFRIMSSEEITRASSRGLDVQLHTHRHTLPDASEAEMRTEVEENKEIVERLKGTECRHFCYPSGLHSARQPEWLAAMGLASSTTCDIGMNGPETHPHRLRRILDRETWSTLEFEAAMCGVFREPRVPSSSRGLEG